ncbi:DNA ligase, phage-associated [Kaumoebavirus]|uniref:DNA ligase, phage-associated n=1 Tax=Kaumoebavirus TaxID=1859492 RepID=UPI0009C3DDE0|nr:DNA ligase, phage-associated [Kaumoebavirus]ARA71938.1 DNA ligase, phage-associated [Kaumoebavirus]
MNRNLQSQPLTDFPFQLEDDVLMTPSLYNKKAGDKILHWRMYTKVVSKKGSKMPITSLQMALDKYGDNYYAEYWTSYYQMPDGKETISTPTVVKEGKNLGKKNATTPLTQALKEVRSKWYKKIDDGYAESYEDAESGVAGESDGVLHDYPFPMALHDFKKFGHKLKQYDEEDNEIIDLFVQPKLNGVRMIIYIPEEGPFVCYSRGRKPYTGTEYLWPDLEKIREDYTDIYLDGEFFTEGQSLQNISGQARRQKIDVTTKLNFNIFDAFYTSESYTFEDRNSFVKDMFENEFVYLKMVPTHRVHSMEEIDALYKDYLEKEYEGLVLRSPEGTYPIQYHKESRSYENQKYKPIEDDEFEVVDFTEGIKGKDVGAIVWVCKVKGGKTFTVVPKMTYKDRYALFKELSADRSIFEKKYKGRPLQIEFSHYSDEGLPQQPHAIGFRDEKM